MDSKTRDGRKKGVKTRGRTKKKDTSGILKAAKSGWNKKVIRCKIPTNQDTVMFAAKNTDYRENITAKLSSKSVVCHYTVECSYQCQKVILSVLSTLQQLGIVMICRSEMNSSFSSLKSFQSHILQHQQP